MAAGPEVVVALSGAYRTFDADAAPVRALRGATLRVQAGEFVAITGPSGCGKSTLLSLVAGLDVADEGTVVVAGQDLTRLSADALAEVRRRHVGIVFQFFNLIDGLTALENVLMPMLIGRRRRRPAETRARDLLGLLGIADKADQLPASLSGGQRQRLAIARALANEPTVLLADEPTGALDSAGGDEVLELFRRLHGEGQTILLVSHDARIAAAAGRVAEMRDGVVVRGGEPTAGPVAAFGARPDRPAELQP